MANLSRTSFSCSFLKRYRVCMPFLRRKSDAHVVMTDDSATVVLWHPETHFPYEKSLPVPLKQTISSDSVLKVQSSKEFLNILKPKREEVVREELMRMTYSTKHIWFPKKQQFRKKKAPEPDRPYL